MSGPRPRPRGPERPAVPGHPDGILQVSAVPVAAAGAGAAEGAHRWKEPASREVAGGVRGAPRALGGVSGLRRTRILMTRHRAHVLVCAHACAGVNRKSLVILLLKSSQANIYIIYSKKNSREMASHLPVCVITVQLISFVASRIVAFQRCHVLIPGTWDYVTPRGEKDSEDVTSLRLLARRRAQWNLKGP